MNPLAPGSNIAPADARREGRFLLSVVVPCYNEQAVIELTHTRLVSVLGTERPFDLEIVYVDDGSADDTATILARLGMRTDRTRVVQLSRNFGHQPAVSAGLAHANGDVVVVIDADLQDPPEVILEMVAKWREGWDVVFGIRAQRKEGAFKRLAYSAFYRLYRRLAQIDVPVDAGDFSLMDRRVVNVLVNLPERNRFMRGLRSWAGFRQTGLVYSRDPRAAGDTKYPLTKLVRLALDGVFNFSTFPLTVISVLGFLTSLVSAIGFVFFFINRLFGISPLGVYVQIAPGLTAIGLLLMLMMGVVLMSIGVLGAYVGRIYDEVKARPPYVVKSLSGAPDRQRSERGIDVPFPVPPHSPDKP